MTKEQDYLESLFKTARNEPPEVHLETIMGAIDDYVLTGATLTSLSKYPFLTFKNGLIGFVSLSIIVSVFVMGGDLDEKPQITKEVLENNTEVLLKDKAKMDALVAVVDTLEDIKDVEPISKVEKIGKTKLPKTKRNVEEKKEEQKELEIEEEHSISIDSILQEEKIIEIEVPMLDDGLASISMENIIIKEKKGPQTRYLITENTTEEDLIEMTTKLKELNAKMDYHSLKFEGDKLVHFQIKVKKDNDYIVAHHNFSSGASYVYEFGCEMSEAGLFMGLFGTLYEDAGNDNTIPCNPSNHDTERVNSKKEKRKNRKKNRKNSKD